MRLYMFIQLSGVMMRYLGPVPCLRGEGYIHGVLDGQAGHGALGQRNDLVDALHHGLRLEVGLQGELIEDLQEKNG